MAMILHPVVALFEHEQEFFDQLSEGLQRILRCAGINTVHDLALAIRDKVFERVFPFCHVEAIRALQGINYVYLPDQAPPVGETLEDVLKDPER